VESQPDRMEIIVQQLGETVLMTTETIESLAERVDDLSNQVQQQGYQLFALSDAVQTLSANQDDTLDRLNRLTETLQGIAASLSASLESSPERS
jgi:ABC-type transporter Mla subunit MlaD